MPDPFTSLPIASDGARAGARAVVHPYGAHVASWTTADGVERLYLSERSAYREGAAIRGGVPVIFPQFSDRGPLPRHGFARTRTWTLLRHDADGVTLGLADDAATRAAWPHGFAAELSATLRGDALRVALAVTNTGDDALAFTAALHTYLRVDDVAAVSIDGLAGARYRDQVAGGVERTQDAASLGIVGEVDRVFLDVPGPLTVREPGRALVVSAEGFPDAVVWNPGAEKAAALADLDPDGWRRFVCVEAAVVAQPVRLAPGERWTGAQTLTPGEQGATA